MATCYPSALIALDPCRMGLSYHALQVVKAGMLCQWLNVADGTITDPTCDIQEILTLYPCFWNLNKFELLAIQTVLLCRIWQAYGGGGGGTNEWLNPDTSESWLNPDTGETWINPDL